MRYCVSLMAVCGLLVSAALAQSLTERNTTRARDLARAQGWDVRKVDARGNVFELRAIVRGVPYYVTTYNVDAADSLSADELQPGGSSGLDLTGDGVMVGVWDGGAVYTTHPEFEGRVTQTDNPEYPSDHATHVSGTIAATGIWEAQWGGGSPPDGQSQGMAYHATIRSFDWFDDVGDEMPAQAAAGMRASNHSYGLAGGWEVFYDENWNQVWYWFGDITVSQSEDYMFGRYDEESQLWDEVAVAHPRYLFVKSAGNDRTDIGPSPGQSHWYWNPSAGEWQQSLQARDPDGPWDCISDGGIAKNGLTIAATRDVVGGYTSPASVDITSFSSYGPCDDGRIKPDVAGNGYQLFSPTAVEGGYMYWGTSSGTSMSAPNVTGTLALLIQHWRQTHAGEEDMLSSTLKGLVIHTADECGNYPGPDYRFGWGLVNAVTAANQIDFDLDQPDAISEWELNADTPTITLEIPSTGLQDELRATICWIDPAGTPPPAVLNDPAPMLVNDLDLRLESPSGQVHMPWILAPADPGDPATRGDNTRDNVEQIVIASPEPGIYLLTISHKGELEGASQTVSLLVSGMVSSDCNGNGVPDSQDIADGTSEDCNIDGIPDECEVDLSPHIETQPEGTTACEGAVVTLEVEVSGAPPFDYQWRRDGEPIDGATNRTLDVEVEGLGDWEYDVLVTNLCGAVTSEPAQITGEGVRITAQPEDLTLTAGEAGEFSVSVTGPEPITYQWRRNGEPIANATFAVYTVSSADLMQVGTYDVVITTPCGDLTSAVAELTVLPAEPIVPMPADEAEDISIEIELSWAAAAGAAEYDVYFSRTSPPEFADTVTLSTWDPGALEYSTTYYWRIIAKNPSATADGAIWSFTTMPEPPQPPTAPLGPTPADDATGVSLDVILDWDDVAHVDIYQILIGTDTELLTAFRGSTTRSEWDADLGLVGGTTYYWRVIAKNVVGTAPSDIWSFTTSGEAPVTPPDDEPGQDVPDEPTDQPDDDGADEQPTDDQDPTDDVSQEVPDDETQQDTDAADEAGGLCPSIGLAMTFFSLAGVWMTRPQRRRRKH